MILIIQFIIIRVKLFKKKILSFKSPLKFCKNIKEGKTTAEKAEEELKEFQHKISNILKGKNKTGGQIDGINDIKKLYKSR